jgi:hypothetical protein
MLLDSRGASPDRPLTGLVRSPPFRVPPEASLEFVFGGRGDRVGVRLEENANVLAEWHPRDTGGVTPEQHTLREYAGRELRLCVFDESGEAGGYVLVGEVVLLVPAVINPG